MLKLFKYFKPYIWLIIILLALTYIQVMTNLELPDYMAKIVDLGIMGKDNSQILDNGTKMLIVSLLGGIATVGIGFLAAKIATGFAKDLRERVFAKVESFSLAEFNKFSTASLITRSTNDIQQIQMVYIMILRMVLAAPFMAAGAIFKAYNTAPSMSWIIALAVTVMFGVIGILFTFALPKFELLQKLVDKLNLVTRQNLTGLRVIRAFKNEKVEERKFEAVNNDLTNVSLFVNRLMVIMQPVIMLIFNLTTIAIVWYGAKLIGSDSMQIGDMLAFMQYAMQVIMAFLMVSFIFIMVPRASVSAKRIGEVLATEQIIKDPERSQTPKKESLGIVEFKDVTFSYPGADLPALTNISFIAKPGETTAFIGSTGSGKSSLINLIPRFYDVTAGQVLIDGVDVREINLEELYRKIGYVPQKSVLFSGTVESNLKYGAPKAEKKEIEKSIEVAQASEFINGLEKGLQSSIAQGGTNVSGGQKQRLSIARALAKKPEIYIFDDSFSALDFRTDALLRKALISETKNKTVLIIGARVGTIMHADNIIVLDDGKIVGQGKHSTLLKTCDVYKEIALSQLSEKELDHGGIVQKKNTARDDKNSGGQNE